MMGGARAAGTTTTTRQTLPAKNRWELFFPARLGPPRKKSKTIAGVKVTAKVRSFELPPTKNTRYGNVHVEAAWIKEWREAAEAAAKDAQIPMCSRIRLSAVVYRKIIGIADAENDHARLAPLQDGLVDAGVVPKDTYAFVERGQVIEMRSDIRGPGVLLTVEAIDV